MKKFLILLTRVFLTMLHVLAQEGIETQEDIILNNMKNKRKKDLFKVYHFLYNKKYNLYSEEAIKRYKIFKENLKYIDEINDANLSYKLGINQFTDMSFEELKRINFNFSKEKH